MDQGARSFEFSEYASRDAGKKQEKKKFMSVSLRIAVILLLAFVVTISIVAKKNIMSNFESDKVTWNEAIYLQPSSIVLRSTLDRLFPAGNIEIYRSAILVLRKKK